MGITHIITLSNDTDTSIIGWIDMENRTNDITDYIILIPNSRPGSPNVTLLPYNTNHKDEILLERESYIYSIYENEAKKNKQNKLGTIAINPKYINKNDYDVKRNTIYLYNNNNKQYYEVPGSIRGIRDVILTCSEEPRNEYGYAYGGARRNKKHTRRHKNNKKRGKRSRKTRNNRRKH